MSRNPRAVGPRRILGLPPFPVRRSISILVGAARRHRDRRGDARTATYATERRVSIAPFLRQAPAGEVSESALRDAVARYGAHRFDLLGSGWVEVLHGANCTGVEGHRYDSGPSVEADRDGRWLEGRINEANLPESRRIWRLVDPGYRPIDWQLDWKSGARWSEGVWYRDIRYGDRPGADVKVPWELARMQHLPQLALAFRGTRSPARQAAEGEPCRREFRNQVLDFVATNPPRFGVNWTLAMDVAIRVANWLVSWDLFRSYGATFDPEFEAVFARSVYEHARHVATNLEWNPHLVGNHYLANLVGLLFAAAYLERTRETDAWLALAVQELVKECAHQFCGDGSNFEASVPYHRLSGEMAAYATALVLGLPPGKRAALGEYDLRAFRSRPGLERGPIALFDVAGLPDPSPFPPEHFERLERMAEFAVHATRPDGRLVQVGDNDGGRFLRLEPPAGSEGEGLDPMPLIAPLAGLFDLIDVGGHAARSRVEATLAESLAGNSRPSPYRTPEAGSAAARVRILDAGRRDLLDGPEVRDETPAAGRLWGYPDFGLFVYRFPRLYLAVRCGAVGQDGNGGHAHNDQLSFELALDGVPVVVDPGTYLYTPAPEQRNRFRCTAMHNTLAIPGQEQNTWEDGRRGLFRMPERSRGKVFEFSAVRFCGEHRGFGAPHRRTLQVGADRVEGSDECRLGRDGARVWFHLAPGVLPSGISGDSVVVAAGPKRVIFRAEAGSWRIEESLYSPSYGAVRSTKALALEFASDSVRWSVGAVHDEP